jgi:iron complex transport system ATP-binding protein
MNTLCVNHVGFRYGTREVLRDVSFEVSHGSFVGIAGTNGSGKTTLLRLLQRFMKPERGTIHLDGINLNEWSRQDLATRVAAVWQRASVEFTFHVHQLVLLGRTPYLNFFKWPTERDQQVVKSVMQRTDCSHLASRKLTELSAGEFQRVQIAAALAQEPQWILLDEPTTFLDLKQRCRLLSLLQSLQKEGVTILCVSHDLDLLRRYADLVLLLHDGIQKGFGDPEEILSSSNLQEVFEMEALF